MATAWQEVFVFPSWPNLLVFTCITGAQNTWTFPGRDDNPFGRDNAVMTSPQRTAWAQHMATSSSCEKSVLASFSGFSDLLVTNKLWLSGLKFIIASGIFWWERLGAPLGWKVFHYQDTIPFCGLVARSSNLNLTGESMLRICNCWIPIFGANFKINEQFSAWKSGGISSRDWL